MLVEDGAIGCTIHDEQSEILRGSSGAPVRSEKQGNGCSGSLI